MNTNESIRISSEGGGYEERQVESVLLGADTQKRTDYVEKDILDSTPSTNYYETDIIHRDNSKDSKAVNYERPPINFAHFAKLPEVSTRLSKCIHTYARNTVGLGWEVSFIDNTMKEEDTKHGEAIEQKKRVEEFLRKVGAETLTPFTTIMYLMKVDEETLGNGAIEVIRDNGGKPIDLAHVPFVTLRVRKGGTGYIQKRNNKQVFFKNYNDTTPRSPGSGRRSRNPNVKKRATELLHFRLYSPLNDWYGVPRYLASVPALTGNRMSAERNVAFFENDTVPRMIVTVSGGQLGEGSIRRLDEFMSHRLGGVENAHKCLVLNARADTSGFNSLLGGSPPSPSIQITPLTLGVLDDASFQNYRENNDEEVRQAFGIAEIFFQQRSSNRESANTGRRVTNEQEFAPDRLEKEFILNQSIIKEVATPNGGELLVSLKFTGLDTEEARRNAEVATTLSALGAYTPNEMRERIGDSALPDTYDFGDVPLPIALSLFEKLGVPLISASEEALRKANEAAVDDPLDEKTGLPVDVRENKLVNLLERATPRKNGGAEDE